MTVVKGLERTCEDAVVASFTVLSRHFPGVTEKNHEKLVILRIHVKIAEGRAVNTKQKPCRLSHRARCHRIKQLEGEVENLLLSSAYYNAFSCISAVPHVWMSRFVSAGPKWITRKKNIFSYFKTAKLWTLSVFIQDSTVRMYVVIKFNEVTTNITKASHVEKWRTRYDLAIIPIFHPVIGRLGQETRGWGPRPWLLASCCVVIHQSGNQQHN